MLERARWGAAAPSCPHCGVDGSGRFVRPADGVARATRAGGRTARRLWRCARCRRQFSVLTGTVLAGTRLPLDTWVTIAADVAADGAVPRPAQLRERHGLSAEGARRVMSLLASVLDATTPVPGSGPAVLRALLTHEPGAAAQARARARRPRPHPQRGPRADYGG